MKIGTVRPEEARVRDTYAGFHSFHVEETQEPFGSLEVFWLDNDERQDTFLVDQDGEDLPCGWYWWPCFPGCLPDGDPVGPFASSRQALEDADEWNPVLDDDYED